MSDLFSGSRKALAEKLLATAVSAHPVLTFRAPMLDVMTIIWARSSAQAIVKNNGSEYRDVSASLNKNRHLLCLAGGDFKIVPG